MDLPDRPADQRTFPRTPAPSTVWLQCRRAGAQPGSELANGLLDVAEGGLQFLSRELLDIGEAVTVALAGAATYGAIRRRGEVRWVVELGGSACCAGICFDEPLTADDLNALVPADDLAPATETFIFD